MQSMLLRVVVLCTFLVLVACWTKEGSLSRSSQPSNVVDQKQTMKFSAFVTKSRRQRGKT
jgi:hypothetical protein